MGKKWLFFMHSPSPELLLTKLVRRIMAVTRCSVGKVMEMSHKEGFQLCCPYREVHEELVAGWRL